MKQVTLNKLLKRQRLPSSLDQVATILMGLGVSFCAHLALIVFFQQATS